MHAPRDTTARERLRLWLRRAAPYLGLLALNFWLFAPSFFTAQADWLPFTPKPHKHGAYGLDPRSMYQYVLVLILRRDNLDMFRGAIELAAMTLALVWTARTRLRGAVRVLCTTLYVALWVFLAYHHAFAHYFERKPALLEDAKLSLNLWHFLQGYARYSWLAVLAALLYIALLCRVAALVFARVQQRAAHWQWQRRLRLSAALTVPPLLSLLWFGVERDDPVWQLTSKRVAYNAKASAAEAERLSALRDAPPDLRYEALSSIRLARKPDVYLLMLEAYGEILATWDMTDAYRNLMSRVGERFSRAGYHSASAYSAAPVHGGTSWFSISTVHTGVQIDRPQAYEALEHVGARVPSITRFFREQGYLTHALQPGTRKRAGLNRFDLFNHEIPVNAATLNYHGPKYGWGQIPDQYSIGVFRERFFRPIERPRYAFYMCVSTHYAWDHVPHYARSWKSLNGASAEFLDFDASWPALAGTEQIATQLRREYFRSVAYEWRLLTEWLEAEAQRGSVILVVGDHQPRLEWNVPGAVTMNTPVHLISQDAELVERFQARGFQEGMFANPQEGTPFQHAGLLSLLLAELSEAYGEPGSPKAEYYPNGLPLAALNR